MVASCPLSSVALIGSFCTYFIILTSPLPDQHVLPYNCLKSAKAVTSTLRLNTMTFACLAFQRAAQTPGLSLDDPVRQPHLDSDCKLTAAMSRSLELGESRQWEVSQLIAREGSANTVAMAAANAVAQRTVVGSESGDVEPNSGRRELVTTRELTRVFHLYFTTLLTSFIVSMLRYPLSVCSTCLQ